MKKNNDATWLVSLVMALVLFFPVYGQMLSCKSEKAVLVEGHDAEYWRQKYLQSQEELMLWRDVAHMYWQFGDYDYLDDKTWEPVGRHNFWDDCISETATYDKLDSIQQGDWEDFYAEW